MEIICNLNGKSFNNNNNINNATVDDSSLSSSISLSLSSTSSNDSKPLIRNKMTTKKNDTNVFVDVNFNSKEKNNLIEEEEDDSDSIFCICKRKSSDNQDEDMMIECDVCKDWLHFKCVNLSQRISIDIETYVCPRCVSDSNNIIYKKRNNFHRHDYSDSNAAKKAVQAGTRVFVENLLKRDFPDAIEKNVIVCLDGSELNLDYLEKNGFDRPILVENKYKLNNFRIPDQNEIDLTKIEDIVGSDIMLDVIDVERQITVPMTINELNNYFKTEERDKIYNLISFEISKTKLSENVQPPNVVNEISWVSNGVWPTEEDTLKENSSTNFIIKPEVQKYCLISSGKSYTDFHIDFGGSSVWYHIVKGDKIFYLIEPNAENLDAYEKWNGLKNHSEIFLADRVKNCYKFYIKAGNTIFLPTGWIHAVYTPEDSLVFGGNFLQCFNIPLQIKVYEMELRLKTPEKFRFPAFETLQWYAAKYYTQMLKEINSSKKLINQRLFNGLKYLQNTLKKWIHSKDYYQLHDHEIPRRINCDKLVKIMNKELSKAEFNLKQSGSYAKTDSPNYKIKKYENDLLNHLDRKRMFIDGSNDGSTDEEKLSNNNISFKKQKHKEVLSYGNMDQLEIKFDADLETTSSYSLNSETKAKESTSDDKIEKLILKIPKAVANQVADKEKSEMPPQATTGTLKLKLKIINPEKNVKKEKTLDEQIYKKDENAPRNNQEDDEIIKELKHSYADNDFVYPSLNENKNKRNSNEDSDISSASADIAKSGRKRKLKPHAVQYLQPPKQTKKKSDEKKISQDESKAKSEQNEKKKPKKIVDELKEKNLHKEDHGEPTQSDMKKNDDNNNDDDDEDYVDDGEDDADDDEDFKLKCKNNLKLSKKIKKNLIKQQQKETLNDSSDINNSTSELTNNSNSKKDSKKSIKSSNSTSSNTQIDNNKSTKKFKKGQQTTKQRLGKLLKLNRVVNI